MNGHTPSRRSANALPYYRKWIRFRWDFVDALIWFLLKDITPNNYALGSQNHALDIQRLNPARNIRKKCTIVLSLVIITTALTHRFWLDKMKPPQFRPWGCTQLISQNKITIWWLTGFKVFQLGSNCLFFCIVRSSTQFLCSLSSWNREESGGWAKCSCEKRIYLKTYVSQYSFHEWR